MIESPYQLINELKCDEIYFLKKKGSLSGKKISENIETKCGF